MSDGHSLMEKQQQQLPVTNDGWNDAAKEAAERPINGTLLKFADWRWTAGKEATAVPDACPSATSLATTTKANGKLAPAARRKTRGETPASSISSIREPPKPSRSRRQVGAAAARSLAWVI